MAHDDSAKHVNVAAAKVASPDVADAEAIAKGEDVKDAHVSSDTPTDAAPADAALADGFSFDGALAEAAATAGSLTSEAESADEVGFSQFGEDGGSTILLVGALALVALGVIVLVDDNGNGGGNNSAPTIDVDDVAAIDEDSTTGAVITVTTDDADGDDVTVTATSDDGTVTQNDDGTFTFIPTADFNGDATVTISATDGTDTTTQDVTIVVNPVDDPVSFNTDTVTIDVTEDTPFDGNFDGVLVDPDGDAALTIVTQGEHGEVVLNDDGTYTYTPDENFFGTDSYVIQAADDGSTDTITVNVNVAGVNDDPDFGVDEQSFDVAAGGTLEGTLTAEDPDGDTLTYGVETDPEHGTLTVADDGSLTYTPDDGYLGADTFTVNVDDGNGGTDTLDVNVNVLEDVVIEKNIDVPPSGAPVTFDAGDGEYRFTDDVTERTDVIIQNFTADDVIEVTGATADDYNFGTQGGDDLRITFNDGTNFTQIVIEDVIQSGFVFDYETAAAAIGIDNFITFA